MKIDLGLGELAVVHAQMAPLIDKSADAEVGGIETAVASAMLHSFYTRSRKH